MCTSAICEVYFCYNYICIIIYNYVKHHPIIFSNLRCTAHSKNYSFATLIKR